MSNDKLHEECGIFGGYCKTGDIAEFIKQGLLKLQHRGQESAGISTGGASQNLHKNIGLVKDVFKSLPRDLTGKFGIGHVRYSTQGTSDATNAQPFLIEHQNQHISIAHNGNIKLESKLGLQPNALMSDTQVMLEKITSKLKKEPNEWSFEEIGTCLNDNFSQGAFSVVFYLPNRVVAYRDAFGYRPLFFCKAKEGFFIASEDIAFEMLNPIEIVEIKAGFGVEITANEYEIKQFADSKQEQKCVFEPIYFSSPSSNVFGQKIYDTRVKLGKLLAMCDNVDADIIVPVPNSGFAAADGYSIQSGIELKKGLLLEKNSVRSFIQPSQESRLEKVKEKLTPIESTVNGKKIILIDDSVVRGTTSKEVIKMLRKAGAKEIHFRLSSPMILNTCFWGVDIPTTEELLANSHKTEEEIAKHLNADSVKFLSIATLKEFFGENGWCYNCFINPSTSGRCGDSKCKQPTKMPALV